MIGRDGSATPAPVPGLSAERLMAAVGCDAAAAGKWCDVLTAAAARFDITRRPARLAAFLAQIAHESARFTRLAENLNYDAPRLRQIFPRYFPTDELAQQYARKPQAIASRVYANRMGNGDEASQDGWEYRGRGLIQLTGRANYQACGDALKLPLVRSPFILVEPKYAALSAAWFWYSRDLNAIADAGDFERITRIINGGLHGYTERVAMHERARSVLA